MSAIRLQRPSEEEAFEIMVDDRPVKAYAGETIATVLLAAGIRKFHTNLPGLDANRLFCGMGECMQCLVAVDGQSSFQACKIVARPGMRVETRS